MSELVDIVSFFVKGIPIQQGSKTLQQRGGKTWMRNENPHALKLWRARVANEADRGVTFDAPVEVVLSFYMPKPQRPRWPVPAVKPDIDKLTRAVLDGLVDGGLLSDDSRVVELHVYESYAAPEDTGVAIQVKAW